MPTDSSSSSIPKPFFERGEIISERWKVVGELGSGGCGIVYEVEKVSGSAVGIHAAMKAESIDTSLHYSETLAAEATVLRKMQWSKHFCRLYLAGRLSPECNIIVMSLVGRPLSWLRRQNPSQRFTLSTALRLGLQCLEAIKDLHDIGFIHRDVKGSNFAIGQNELSRVVQMIDFGFARLYLCKGKNGICHRKPRQKAPYLGTDRYCSIFVHMRREQGRRDDLWSFLYMLVEFISGSLPWRSSSYKNLLDMKSQSVDKLLKNCPTEFYKIHDHIKTLDYSDRPSYEYIAKIINSIIERKHIAIDEPFDWEVGGKYHSHYLKSIEKLNETALCKTHKKNTKKSTNQLVSLAYDDDDDVTSETSEKQTEELDGHSGSDQKLGADDDSVEMIDNEEVFPDHLNSGTVPAHTCENLPWWKLSLNSKSNKKSTEIDPKSKLWSSDNIVES